MTSGKQIKQIIRAMIWAPTFLCLACGNAGGSGSDAGERLLIIDDDNGMYRDLVAIEGNYDVTDMARFTDPDGGLEILYAVGSPDVEILGLTCVMGTVTTEVCMKANEHLFSALGRGDIPYFVGATSPADIGRETPASRFIIDTVMDNPGEIEIVASGPLTNIATALMIEPALPNYWKALYIMSGEFQRGSNIDFASGLTNGDLNLSVDFPAAEFVFKNAGPCVVIPNELMDDALVTKDDLEYFSSADRPIADFILYEVDLWFYLITNAFGLDGFWPHGMTGLAAALYPEHRADEEVGAIWVKSIGEPSGKHYWGPIVSEIVDDPNLPKHHIYFSFANQEKFRRDFRERLIK